MIYVRPAFDAAHGSWDGAPAYTRPASTTANASWVPITIVARGAALSTLGSAAAVATFTNIVVDVWGNAQSPLGAAAGVVLPIVVAFTAASTPLGDARSNIAVVLAARAAAGSPLAPCAATATVLRYELAGEVRDQGVLVDRRVRAYRLADGGLSGEADTVAGRFRVPVGFTPALHYLVPIDLGELAADYAPPAANRVMSVLAQD